MKTLMTISALCLIGTPIFSQCSIDLTIDHVDCNGDESGSILFDGTGGTAPYSFIVSDASSSILYTGGPSVVGTLAAGSYTIEMSDDGGCTDEVDFEVVEPPALAFSELGFDPCFCDPIEENGVNGVVYAAATGGTPDYSYNWTFPEDGSSTSNTTWGGRECGLYIITVTDAMGCVLQDTVDMTMTNPEASFDINSTDLIWNTWAWEGSAPVDFSCVNTSTGMYNWNDPGTDSGSYYWQLGDWAPWTGPVDYDYEPSSTLSYDGTWGIKLVAETYTGCLDTAVQFIMVFGPLGTEESEAGLTFIQNSHSQLLTVKKFGFDKEVQLLIYDLSGKKLVDAFIEEQSTQLEFGFGGSIYLFDVIDPQTTERLASGKFGF